MTYKKWWVNLIISLSIGAEHVAKVYYIRLCYTSPWINIHDGHVESFYMHHQA